MLLTPLLLALFFSFVPASSTQDTPSYYPEGPQQNISKQTLIDGGWTLCWEDYYNSRNNLNDVFSQCNGNYLIYAGGVTGADSYLLLAAGERSAVTTITEQNQTTLNNGTYWYYHSGWGSIGFAPNSTISQNSADVYAAWDGFELDDGSLRLSWHSDGTDIFFGWRVGTNVGLNGSTDYQRAIWQTDSVNAVEPTPEITEEPTPTPTPTETPSESPTPTPTPSETIEPTPEPTPTQTQNPEPVDPGPDPTPVETPIDEPVEEVQEEIQEEEEIILEPSQEPTPIEEIISGEEEINNAIDELIVNEEEISDEQLDNITELLLENYEVNEVMPVAELLEELSDEQVLELLEQLDENQIIEYREGVELEAGVAVVFEQLADPAALLGEFVSDPGQVLEALGQLGADMTEEERGDSQQVVVATVIVSQILGSVTMTSSIVQMNARAEIRRIT